MKTLFGILTTIATVAGIATIASKNEREALEEQKKLMLEEERLRLEAEEKNRRFKQEQEHQEYQRKLANAPKKAIYKAIPMECPLCNGQREIDDEKHQIKCPYCSHVEMLTVERYEIDQQAFQQQLQEEEKQKAAIEAQKQRIKNLDTAIGIFSIITGFILVFSIIMSPIIGSAFLIPSLIILSILIYHRFPKVGKKVWNVIKLPLICILLFPLPISFLLMKSEKLKSKFSKKVRIGLSIVTWILYVVLIVILGGLYVKAFKNALHPRDYYQYTPPQIRKEVTSSPTTQEATTQEITTQEATTTQEQTTHETTSISIDPNIPASNKTNIEYYDANTNFEVEFGGIVFSIPNCWYEQQDYRTDTQLQYYDSKDKMIIGHLVLTSLNIVLDDLDEETFISKCDEISESFLEGIIQPVAQKLPHLDIKSKKYKIYSTYKSGVFHFKEKDVNTDVYLTLIYNAENKKLVLLTLTEYGDSDKTYWNDYNKIIGSIENNKDTSTDNHDEVIEATNESVSAIYPQEEAYRAAVVSLTNALSFDVFTSDGSQHDTSKYHSYSDTSAFYMSILSKGTWTEKSSNTWHVDNLKLKPTGYDIIYNAPINVSTEANASLDVTFDGTNYIISNISGIYAIPGKEEIGTDLSYLNSDNTSKAALTVSKNMIENDR